MRNTVPPGSVLATARKPPSSVAALSLGNEPVDQMTQLACALRREVTLRAISSISTTARPSRSWPVTMRRICRGMEAPSSLQYTSLDAALPARALELGHIVLAPRIAEAEIADEAPLPRHVEERRHTGGIEDRDPAEADALRARRQPHRADRGDHGIFGHLRHGAPAEPMAARGRPVAEDGEMMRRLAQALELQGCIAFGEIARVVGARLCVAGAELGHDRGAARGIIDQHEPPRLAQADRRGKAGSGDEARERTLRQRLAAKAPHVAPPGKQRCQLLAERAVEIGRRAGYHGALAGSPPGAARPS